MHHRKKISVLTAAAAARKRLISLAYAVAVVS